MRGRIFGTIFLLVIQDNDGGMVKLADAADLNSVEDETSCGFDSLYRYKVSPLSFTTEWWT